MAIEFKMEGDNIGLFRVSGTLGKEELEMAQNECESAIKMVGKIKILVLLDEFRGWEKYAKWEDISFAERNDPYIDRLAIVGDEEWKDLVYAFTLEGLRPVPIAYFGPGQESFARQWLDGSD